MRWLVGSPAALVILFALVCDARAATFVIPPGLEDVPGNDRWSAPFTSPFSERTQILYDSSFFSTPLVIESIAFRHDERAPDAFDYIVLDVQVNMSTFEGDSLSEVFASNIGADEAVVKSRGTLQVVIDSADSFDLVITLDKPFRYDPARGGLLVDIQKYTENSIAVNWDWHRVAVGGSVRTVVERADYDNIVPVAQITGEPVPEPSSLIVAVIAAAGSIAYGWRRRRRSA